MALDYAGTAALMKDQAFADRVKVSCLHFAQYISGEAPDVPAHNTRAKWSQHCFQYPDATAQEVMPVVVMDDKVQQEGAAITDADLQTAVETSVNKII